MHSIRLAWTYLRIGIANELQYRVNFFIQILQSMIALAIGLVGLMLVFDYTSSLNGWSANELLVVMGIFIAMGGVIRAAIQPSMNRLIEEIRQGTLDYALTKPADSQFFVSVREFRFWQLVDVMVGGVVMGVGLNRAGESLSLWQALAFIAAMVMGALLVYSFWLMITSSAFWIIRVDEIVNLFEGIYAAGRWPVGVYPNWLRFSLTFLVPVAFAVTIPAEALTGRLSLQTLLGAVALTIFFLAVSRWVFKRGARSYSGASA